MTLSLLSAATAVDISVFVVAAVLVLSGAFGVVLFRNPIHSALSLVVTLCGIAILFVEQEAHFLAAVQVIVYAGAIVVLFLFVIMLLGVDRTERLRREPLPGHRILAIIVSLVIAGLVVVLVDWNWNATGAASQGGAANGPGSNVQKLANSIFTQYLFPFEATSVLLVIAVVGAVVLARRPVGELPNDGTDEEATDLLEQPNGGPPEDKQ